MFHLPHLTLKQGYMMDGGEGIAGNQSISAV